MTVGDVFFPKIISMIPSSEGKIIENHDFGVKKIAVLVEKTAEKM